MGYEQPRILSPLQLKLHNLPELGVRGHRTNGKDALQLLRRSGLRPDSKLRLVELDGFFRCHLATLANAKVSDRSQPPQTFDLS